MTGNADGNHLGRIQRKMNNARIIRLGTDLIIDGKPKTSSYHGVDGGQIRSRILDIWMNMVFFKMKRIISLHIWVRGNERLCGKTFNGDCVGMGQRMISRKDRQMRILAEGDPLIIAVPAAGQGKVQPVF